MRGVQHVQLPLTRTPTLLLLCVVRCRALLFLLPEEVGFLRYLRAAKVSTPCTYEALFYGLRWLDTLRHGSLFRCVSVMVYWKLSGCCCTHVSGRSRFFFVVSNFFHGVDISTFNFNLNLWLNLKLWCLLQYVGFSGTFAPSRTAAKDGQGPPHTKNEK